MDEPSSRADTGTDTADGEPRPTCDYCRLECPEEPIRVQHEDVEYTYCSRACREASDDHGGAHAEYHGFRQFRPGVAAMDAGLPQGIPRNSFVLLSAQSGTRDEALQAELVWRTLQRGEPAVVVSFLETPVSIAQQFVTLNWNVLPYLESGQLHILDCFTYRLEGNRRVVERMDEWNRHLHEVATSATTRVTDPTDTTRMRSKLDSCLDRLDMTDQGIVVIDSLTELGALVQSVNAYSFVKNVRADIPKGRFVPVFASATVSSEDIEFPHDLGYMVDGVVDLDFDSETVEDTLLKRLRIRKMNGVLTIPEWFTYEFTSDKGLVVFDPEEEIEKSREERAEEDADGGTE